MRRSFIIAAAVLAFVLGPSSLVLGWTFEESPKYEDAWLVGRESSDTTAGNVQVGVWYDYRGADSGVMVPDGSYEIGNPASYRTYIVRGTLLSGASDSLMVGLPEGYVGQPMLIRVGVSGGPYVYAAVWSLGAMGLGARATVVTGEVQSYNTGGSVALNGAVNATVTAMPDVVVSSMPSVTLESSASTLSVSAVGPFGAEAIGVLGVLLVLALGVGAAKGVRR